MHEAHVARFIHTSRLSRSSEFTYNNPASAQSLQWILRSDCKTPIDDVTLEINGRPVVDLKEPLLAGASLKYAGGADIVIADASWKELSRLPVNPALMRINPGIARIRISSKPAPDNAIKLELRALGSAMPIKPK